MLPRDDYREALGKRCRRAELGRQRRERQLARGPDVAGGQDIAVRPCERARHRADTADLNLLLENRSTGSRPVAATKT
jgi:hypothetical protein